MSEEQILNNLKSLVIELNGKSCIDCQDALSFARDNKLDTSLVARVINANGIKITNCQLGCF